MTPRKKHKGKLSKIALDNPAADCPSPAPAKCREEGTGRFISKYRPVYCEKLIEHMSMGASLTSFAASINVTPATLHNWAAEHAEFGEAKDRAFAKAQAWWEAQARAGLFDTVESSGQGKERVTVTRRLNANVFRCVMGNLFNWSDKQAQEVLTRTTHATLEDYGVRPYEEWEIEDLSTLSDLTDKYRREPTPHANQDG